MPLLEYRALLLDTAPEASVEPPAQPVTRAGAVIPPAPLPVTYRLTAGLHLFVDIGGTIRLRRAPDIYELILEDII